MNSMDNKILNRQSTWMYSGLYKLAVTSLYIKLIHKSQGQSLTLWFMYGKVLYDSVCHDGSANRIVTWNQHDSSDLCIPYTYLGYLYYIYIHLGLYTVHRTCVGLQHNSHSKDNNKAVYLQLLREDILHSLSCDSFHCTTEVTTDALVGCAPLSDKRGQINHISQNPFLQTTDVHEKCQRPLKHDSCGCPS